MIEIDPMQQHYRIVRTLAIYDLEIPWEWWCSYNQANQVTAIPLKRGGKQIYNKQGERVFRGMSFPSEKHKEFVELLEALFLQADKDSGINWSYVPATPEPMFEVRFVFAVPTTQFRNKSNGQMKRWDVGNYPKIIEDALFNHINSRRAVDGLPKIDDCQVVHGPPTKLELPADEPERIVIALSTVVRCDGREAPHDALRQGNLLVDCQGEEECQPKPKRRRNPNAGAQRQSRKPSTKRKPRER